MRFQELILYFVAKNWSKNILKKYQSITNDGNYSSEEYNLNYALVSQYMGKVKYGLNYDIYDKNVLEIGCGHGGISTFIAINGAKRVVGVDINTFHLEIARKFKKSQEERLNIAENGLNLEFIEMSAYDLKLEEGIFDVVIADNVFEHFMEPEKVMSESHRVLKKGGMLIVPTFNSIYSKYGLHLKRGLRVPWSNLIFSEKTICNVMKRLAKEDTALYEAYPGLKNNPSRVKDLREYGDLNSITHRRFIKIALENGYSVDYFSITPPGNSMMKLFFRYLFKISVIRNSLISDIFSLNAAAMLRKK